jgi:hypothetical protein
MAFLLLYSPTFLTIAAYYEQIMCTLFRSRFLIFLLPSVWTGHPATVSPISRKWSKRDESSCAVSSLFCESTLTQGGVVRNL